MKRKLLILGAFLSFLLSGCSYELELPHPSEAETLANFGITDARHYFEQNADNLAPLRLSPETKSQSELLSHLELTPEWDKAMQSGHKGVSLIEVPIQSNSILQTSEKFIRNGKVVFRKLFPITRRLIVARRNTGETEMFVATIIPTIVGGRNVMKSVENFRYLGGGDFTGKVFCSTLEGEFVKAFGYTDGQMNGTLAVMKKRQLQEHGEESWAQEYTTVSFSEAVKTSASTYTFDEGGEGWIGGGGNKCPHGMNEKDCPHCLDEVIVTACPYCHMQGGCICSKCFYCFNREHQCTCPRCTRCYQKIQECTCYYYPDPDPNPYPGGGTGGGGTGGSSTGGGNGGQGVLPNVNLTNEEYFVPYNHTHDCMRTAIAIMKNYGIPTGSSANVYQLLFERNGSLEYFDTKNYRIIYDNAIACINRHLDANRPIIVGVNHTLGRPINEHTTDHWIIIAGRGYDITKKQYYFTYIDTGRNQASVGCDIIENRLYYDSSNYTLRDPKAGANNKVYDVSQVRPNDNKNLHETIPQPIP